MKQKIEQIFMRAFPPSLNDSALVKESAETFADLIIKKMCDMMEQAEDDWYSSDPTERASGYGEWLYFWRNQLEDHWNTKND